MSYNSNNGNLSPCSPDGTKHIEEFETDHTVDSPTFSNVCKPKSMKKGSWLSQLAQKEKARRQETSTFKSYLR